VTFESAGQGKTKKKYTSRGTESLTLTDTA